MDDFREAGCLLPLPFIIVGLPLLFLYASITDAEEIQKTTHDELVISFKDPAKQAITISDDLNVTIQEGQLIVEYLNTNVTESYDLSGATYTLKEDVKDEE